MPTYGAIESTKKGGGEGGATAVDEGGMAADLPPPLSSAADRQQRRRSVKKKQSRHVSLLGVTGTTVTAAARMKAASERGSGHHHHRKGGGGGGRRHSMSVLSSVLESPRSARQAQTAAQRRRAQYQQRLRNFDEERKKAKAVVGGVSSGGGGGGGGAYMSLMDSRGGGASIAATGIVASSITTCGGRNHSWAYTLLNPRSHQPHAVFFKRFVALVIVFDLVFFVCSTEPKWQDRPIFYYAEGVTSSVFLVEYVARFVTCTESTRFRPHGPIFGRVRFALTVPSVIDALATFPFFIELFTPLDLPTTTYLRMFRLLRLLKTEGFAKAFDSINRVIYYNREILYVAAMLCVFLVLVTAVAMYYLRPSPKHGGEVESDFSSIAATMYLTTLMLTGQGGPSGDLPWYTQAIVVLTGIFSVAMFAIPASMLTWGFEAEAERLAQKARRKRKQALTASTANIEGSCYFDEHSSTSESSDAYASSSSVDTSDEEYQKIIGGGDDEDGGGGGEDEEDAEKKKALKEILDMFTKADDDGSGTLTKQEFVKMVEPLLEAAAAAAAASTAAVSNGGGVGGTGTGPPPPAVGGGAAASAIAGSLRAASASSARAVGAAAAAKASSSAGIGTTSDAVVLSTRVARLEAKVDSLTNKVDRLIQLSERPGDRAYRDPFP